MSEGKKFKKAPSLNHKAKIKLKKAVCSSKIQPVCFFSFATSNSPIRTMYLVDVPIGPLAGLGKVEDGRHRAHDGDVPIGAHAKGEAKEVVAHPGKRHLVRQSPCAAQP